MNRAKSHELPIHHRLAPVEGCETETFQLEQGELDAVSLALGFTLLSLEKQDIFCGEQLEAYVRDMSSARAKIVRARSG